MGDDEIGCAAGNALGLVGCHDSRLQRLDEGLEGWTVCMLGCVPEKQLLLDGAAILTDRRLAHRR